MKFLRKLLGLDSGQRIEHPVLGEGVLVNAKHGAYWEIETELDDHPFTLIIDTEDLREPTPEQVVFFQRFSERPQRAFEIAGPVLAPAYERWSRRPLPAEWQGELCFVGMTVPGDADPHAEYELSFEGPTALNSPHFACTVKEGQAVAVETST